MHASYPKVGVVLLNYQGWEDTIECLESLYKLDYPAFRIVVVDNASPNCSLDYIEKWAQGALSAYTPRSNSLRGYSFPPVAKPVAYQRLAAAGGEATKAEGGFLTLIQAGSNGGFARGNNIGINFLLADPEISYVWLLNNDTVVHPQALQEMVRQMGDQVAMCGSSLLYYYQPGQLQACGGARFNKMVFTAHLLHTGQEVSLLQGLDPKQIVEQMDYVIGASMLMSVPFLKEKGLLEEAYFLFYEEMDMALRLGEHYRLAYAKDSLVYHKEGGSIGTTATVANKSTFLDQVSFESKIKFVKKNYPQRFPLLFSTALVYFLHRLLHGKFSNAAIIAKSFIKSFKN